MNKPPSVLRHSLLIALALGSTALSACVAGVPVRAGVDYGYVGGGYSTAPYGDPYDTPYYDNRYYGYNGGYGSPYYGGGYYYGPSTTYVYTRDRYYPAYGYRSHDHHYRDHDRDDHDDGHHGNGGGHGGDHGDWGHNGPGRPGGNAGGPPPRNDSTATRLLERMQQRKDPPRPSFGTQSQGNSRSSPAQAPRNDSTAGRLLQRMQRKND